jgi:predicted nucleotidyltransferase
MNKEIEQIIKEFSEDTQRILQDNLVAEYLFGSTARDEAGKYSDIDILIIVQQFDHQIRKRLSQSLKTLRFGKRIKLIRHYFIRKSSGMVCAYVREGSY